MRIAFLSSEFPTTNSSSSGGLASYLFNIANELKNLGCEVDVFVIQNSKFGKETDECLESGVYLRKVRSFTNSRLFRILHRTLRLSNFLSDLILPVVTALGQSWLFRRAILSSEQTYDVIQCPDFQYLGVLVSGGSGCKHLVRLSSPGLGYHTIDGNLTLGRRICHLLLRLQYLRGFLFYAPSKFAANWSIEQDKIPCSVIRPPCPTRITMYVDVRNNDDSNAIPNRYHVFIGQFCKRKGADLIMEALRLVWQRDPTYRFVVCGKAWHESEVRQFASSSKGRFVYIGPQERSAVQRIVSLAECSVLPSLIDNLPNSVIESLNLGVPVIGTRGTSIDELIEDKVNGLLVTGKCPSELANSMLKVWRFEIEFEPTLVRLPAPLVHEMESQKAAKNLLTFALGSKDRRFESIFPSM